MIIYWNFTVEFTLTKVVFYYIDIEMKIAVNHGELKILIDNLECSVVI